MSDGPPYYSDGLIESADEWKYRQHRPMGRLTMLTVADRTIPAVPGKRHVFPLMLLGMPLVLAVALLTVLKIRGYL